MPDPSPRTSVNTTGKPPRQGALVVLLSAMLMVNLSVVIVVLADGWFEGKGPAQGEAIAQVDPARPGGQADGSTATRQPAEPGGLADTSVDAPNERGTSAQSDSPNSDSADTDTTNVPAHLPQPAPAVATPGAGALPGAPPTQPVTTRPPLEFFGIPVLE
ncbi:hypothetical protein OT109_04980 [Phycisphaeraceae bacterium D3-23]